MAISATESQDVASLKGELLPGIPNDIVLKEITTKLSVKDVTSLSLLSNSWKEAVGSRAVYGARLRDSSTESFLAFILRDMAPDGYVIFLYSLRERKVYQLPPKANLVGFYCNRYLALDGRLYVIGHTYPEPGDIAMISEMRVLDLAAGNMQWKQCASLQQLRHRIVCGAKNGKLYVFGATYGANWESEVYDPKVDAWFPIKPLEYWGIPYKVTPAGEELYVVCFHGRSDTPSVKVYHPLKDEWRTVELGISRNDPVDLLSEYHRVFIAQGKICYNCSDRSIYVYDNERRSWALRCSVAYEGMGPTDPFFLWPVGNELLAVAHWDGIHNKKERWSVLESSGFSSSGGHVVWSKVKLSRSSNWFFATMFCFHDDMCFVDL